MDIAQAFSIVLVEPQNPINVGTVMRAMKNMGLRQLVLVHPAPMDLERTQISAHHAEDMMQSVQIFDSLPEALDGVHVSCGFSARCRTQTWASLDMEDAVSQTLAMARNDRRIAFVFGREQTGLTNRELEMCTYQVHIDTAEYSSLNLAQAVLLACHALRRQNASSPRADSSAISRATPENHAPGSRPITLPEQNRLLRTLEQTLVDIGYYKSEDPNTALHRVRNILSRADLHDDEFHLLMGMIREVDNFAKMIERGKKPRKLCPRGSILSDAQPGNAQEGGAPY